MSKIVLDKLGADPECFLRHKETGLLVSAIDLVQGTKEDPYPIKELGEGFFLQTDNTAVEWNVPPTSSYTEMYNNNKKMMDYINSIIPQDLELIVQSSGEFDWSYLQDPRAIEAGCSSSFNCWALCMNDKPDYSVTNIRAAGGHIHCSYTNPNDEDSLKLLRAFDLFLGVPSVILDSDKNRREFYGKAGEFRMTRVGMEYRSLGNFWIADMELTKWVFESVNKAIEFVNAGKEFSDEDQLNIQAAINTSDKDLALELIYKYNMVDILPVLID